MVYPAAVITGPVDHSADANWGGEHIRRNVGRAARNVVLHKLFIAYREVRDKVGRLCLGRRAKRVRWSDTE